MISIGFKRFVVPFAMSVAATGSLVIFFASNIAMIGVVLTLAGIGLGWTMPGFYSRVSKLSPPATVNLALSLVVSSQGIGSFLQPYILTGILKLTHQYVGRFSYGIIGFGILIITFLALFMSIPKHAEQAK
ncbi:MFS transporter [Moorella stamsii]|uniref:MFS transporter n=1 Tax=Neomoorella stamsii TaxID=1266720 RepID=UPI0006D55D44|nr:MULTISPECIES: MFS transporter [Moorella]